MRLGSKVLKLGQNVVWAVNQARVVTYHEIGRMIVEEEQNGKERADYGRELLKGLSAKLTKEFGRVTP